MRDAIEYLFGMPGPICVIFDAQGFDRRAVFDEMVFYLGKSNAFAAAGIEYPQF